MIEEKDGIVLAHAPLKFDAHVSDTITKNFWRSHSTTVHADFSATDPETTTRT